MATPLIGVPCSACKGVMYRQVIQKGRMTRVTCPRCHIEVRLPRGLDLVAAPFVTSLVTAPIPASA